MVAGRIVNPTRQDVALRCVRVVVWLEDDRLTVDEDDLPLGLDRAAAAGRRPMWVQLALPRLGSLEQRWFEGSVDPWSDPQQPGLDWRSVEPVLETVGLNAPALDVHERRMLSRLPYLYGRGVARMAREVWGRPWTYDSRPTAHAGRLRFFPAVGFQPVDETDPPRFETVRLIIGVIRNVVVTVRLPDLWWDDDREGFDYAPGGALDVRERYFPFAEDLAAEDVAEAIALWLASTAREVSERVRPRLTEIERRWGLAVGSAARASHDQADGDATLKDTSRDQAECDPIKDARRVTDLTDSLHRLDRQLARLLRRLGTDGRDDGADPPDRCVPPDIARRYRFALDELRSLEADCRLASDAVARAISMREHEDRERFHLVAGVLASVILIPTLVASVYGANVALPAQGSRRGFIALVLFIIACAMAGLLLVSAALRHGWSPSIVQSRRGAVKIAAAVVVATFAGGLVEVLRP